MAAPSESVIYDESLIEAQTIAEVTRIHPKLKKQPRKIETDRRYLSLDLVDKYQALETAKRRNIAVLHVRGSHFDLGFQIGRTFGNLIEDFLGKNENMAVNLEFYETERGKLVFNSSYEAISMRFPEYIRELKGIAEGSGIPFYKIMLLHLEDIMFSVVGNKAHRANEMGASATLCLNNATNRVLAHIQDSPPEGIGNGYIVRAQITEECPPQEFTAFCIGGLLPGSQMAFNNDGLLLTVNSIDVRKCNETGIPLLACRTIEQIEETALCRGHGVSNGLSVNVVFIHDKPKPSFYNIEISPHYPPTSISAKSTYRVLPLKTPFFYHFHRFLRLTVPTILGTTSMDRLKQRWELIRRSPPPTSNRRIIELLGDIVSSRADKKMIASAIGVYNLGNMTWSLYADNPKETDPLYVVPLIT